MLVLMSRTLVSIFALLLVALPLTSIALPMHASAQTDDRAAARAEFEQGSAAFAANSFESALQHFQEAYRLAPHPNVRVNIANCYDQLDRPIEALFHYELFLTEADRPPAEMRRTVDASVRRLRGRVGSIALQVTPDGALITIDGSEQRRAPVTDPVRVVAGSHRIEVRLDGYQPETQTVEVAGGASARVALRLRRAEVAVAVVPQEPVRTDVTPVDTHQGEVAQGTDTQVAAVTPAEETHEEQAQEPAHSDGGLRINTPTIIAGSVTVAALLVAAITGPLALVANDRFERNVFDSHDLSLSAQDRADAVRDGEAAASDARTFALVTDISLITAAVGAGATVAFFIFAQEEETQADVAVLPVLAPGYAGVLGMGSF
jgi:hypothetical protein